MRVWSYEKIEIVVACTASEAKKGGSTASSSINSVDIIASFARRAIEQFRSL
jgi:hypothetical protein